MSCAAGDGLRTGKSTVNDFPTELVGTTDFPSERLLLDAEEKLWDQLLNERRKGARADTAKLAKLRLCLRDQPVIDAVLREIKR